MQIIKDFGRLIKFRVNIIVVLSSILGYLIASQGENIKLSHLLGLFLGGFLTTGAAHAINQILERKHDAKMSRTKDRPLPTNRMSVIEVVFYAILMTVLGTLSFIFLTNKTAVLLSVFSLLVYSFIYTPLKRVNSIAVVIGAIPGALPPTIGYVAYTGVIDEFAIFLFVIQFVWQFPHFWSIAWIWDEEYSKAGYKLLPIGRGKTQLNAFLTFISSLILIPIILYLYINFNINIFYFIAIAVLTFMFNYRSYLFYKNPNTLEAKKMMLHSVIYLPVVLIIFVLAFWV